MNMFTVLAILCLSAPITAFKISLTSANESEYGKAYPGFTVFEKDGQYARFIGPLFFKLDFGKIELPFKLWKPFNISATAASTVELFSLYIDGEIIFEGSTLFSVDGSIDQCFISKLDCPYLPGVPVHRSGKVIPGDLGIFPGWYNGHFDFFTIDKNHGRYRIARFEYKLKILDV